MRERVSLEKKRGVAACGGRKRDYLGERRELNNKGGDTQRDRTVDKPHAATKVCLNQAQSHDFV